MYDARPVKTLEKGPPKPVRDAGPVRHAMKGPVRPMVKGMAKSQPRPAVAQTKKADENAEVQKVKKGTLKLMRKDGLLLDVQGEPSGYLT